MPVMTLLVILSCVAIAASAYGDALVRIMLGNEAFNVYFGQTFWDWVRRYVNFGFVPGGFLLATGFPWELLFAVSSVE